MRLRVVAMFAACLACLALGLVAACGRSDLSPPDAAPPDARPPLPDPPAYLAASSYDCTATGPFEPPARPHSLDCFADPACASRLVAGHRIANPFAPENSLSALRAAILLGVDIVETDVRLTSDGEVVLIHDGDVDRTTIGTGNVGELTLAELRSYPLRVEPEDPPGDFSCERVPILDEVFALSRDRIVVELEVKDTAAGVRSAEYLRDRGLFDQAFLLCDDSECAAARAAVPDVPIMTRPRSPDEVAGDLAYAPPPIIVHIDPTNTFLTPAVVAEIHDASAKVYANAFVLGDAAALASADLTVYLQMYDDGLDVVQAEYPHFALQALGRLPAP